MPYISTPARYIFAASAPIPITEPIRIEIEIMISYQATVLIAILVNIAIGEVNGRYEHTIIAVLSIAPVLIDIITTINAITNRKVIGITDVFISSSLDAVEPIAPNIKAYIRKPRTKKIIIYTLGK